MKFIPLVLIALIILPATAHSDRIYGTIKVGNKPIEAGIKLEITTVDDNSIDTARTDNLGAYGMYVRGEGTYKLKIYYRPNQTPFIMIYSFESIAARYDLLIYKDENGNYQIGRQ